jgi:hypothetical protein
MRTSVAPARFRRPALAGALAALCLAFYARGTEGPGGGAPEDYDTWIKPYTQYWCSGVRGGRPDDPRGVPKLTITWQVYEDLDPFFSRHHEMIWNTYGGCTEWADGSIEEFIYTFSGPRDLEHDELKRFEKLAADLPDPGKRLPPRDRRVLVQTPEAGGIRARVYDRGKLPEEMLEMLRMTGTRIEPWMPTFKSRASWRTRPKESIKYSYELLAMATTPGGRMLVSVPNRGPISIWKVETHELVKKVNWEEHGDEYSSAILFSSDGSLAINAGWRNFQAVDATHWKPMKTISTLHDGIGYMERPRLTPDGENFRDEDLGARRYSAGPSRGHQ